MNFIKIILLAVIIAYAQNNYMAAIASSLSDIRQQQFFLKNNIESSFETININIESIQSRQQTMQMILINMQKDLFDTKMKLYDLEKQNDSLKALLQKKRK